MKQAQNSFRPLNANELHMLEKFGGIQNTETLPDRIGVDWGTDLRVSYEHLDEFIVCFIVWGYSNYGIALWRGVSRRSMYDKPNRLRGEALAFKRAILKSRPVVI